MTFNNPTLYHKIFAHQHTVVSSICITTIVYDHSMTSTQNYRILVSLEDKLVDSINAATNMFPDKSFYIFPNSMYYGIASMKIFFQPATSQTLLFDTNNFANFFASFKGNPNIN